MNQIHMGNTLEVFLKSRRIKVSEVSEFLGITRQTWRSYVKSEKISYTVICKLQEFLNHDFNFYPVNKAKFSVKAYTISLEEKDGFSTLNIQNSGFNFFELLGILEKAKNDVLKKLEQDELEEKLKINNLC